MRLNTQEYNKFLNARVTERVKMMDFSKIAIAMGSIQFVLDLNKLYKEIRLLFDNVKNKT